MNNHKIQTVNTLALAILCLLSLSITGCGDGGGSATSAQPYPKVSRWHYTVTNNMRMKITDVVIDKLDLPVKFDVLNPGDTKTLLGQAQHMPNKIELSWFAPDGTRKSKNVKFKPVIPASFNGKLYLKIIDPNKVELRVDTFAQPK